MKLYYSSTSPYSRKVRLVLHFKGLFEQVEQILINPFSNDETLNALNPLGKIPVFIDKDNTVVFDSPIICQYLDAMKPENSLIPEQHVWEILQQQALADGIMDAAYQVVIELRRPAQSQSKEWITTWSNDVKRSLEAIEDSFALNDDTIDLAHLSYATAISYLEFRLPHLLNDDLIKLLRWYRGFKQHPAMIATELN